MANNDTTKKNKLVKTNSFSLVPWPRTVVIRIACVKSAERWIFFMLFDMDRFTVCR